MFIKGDNAIFVAKPSKLLLLVFTMHDFNRQSFFTTLKILVNQL
jgi:hypothetical protein